jgi:hypothetical protein
MQQGLFKNQTVAQDTLANISMRAALSLKL